MDVFWQKGGGKDHPGQNLPEKDPDKTTRTMPSRTKAYVLMYVLLKMGVRDMWRTLGRSQDVWQSVTGERVKIGPK